jgi:hypothetical protein
MCFGGRWSLVCRVSVAFRASLEFAVDSGARMKAHKPCSHGKQVSKWEVLWLRSGVGRARDECPRTALTPGLRCPGLLGLYSSFQFKKHIHIPNLS